MTILSKVDGTLYLRNNLGYSHAYFLSGAKLGWEKAGSGVFGSTVRATRQGEMLIKVQINNRKH